MIVLWLIVDERIASANDRLFEDIRCMLTQGACFVLGSVLIKSRLVTATQLRSALAHFIDLSRNSLRSGKPWKSVRAAVSLLPRLSIRS